MCAFTDFCGFKSLKSFLIYSRVSKNEKNIEEQNIAKDTQEGGKKGRKRGMCTWSFLVKRAVAMATKPGRPGPPDGKAVGGAEYEGSVPCQPMRGLGLHMQGELCR